MEPQKWHRSKRLAGGGVRLLWRLQARIIRGDTLAMLKPLDRMLKDALGLPGLDLVGFVLPLRNLRAPGFFAVRF